MLSELLCASVYGEFNAFCLKWFVDLFCLLSFQHLFPSVMTLGAIGKRIPGSGTRDGEGVMIHFQD